LEQGEAFAKPAGTSAWVLKMGAGSTLPPGSYRVELLENEKPVTSIPFHVGAEQTATVEPELDTSTINSETAPPDTTSTAPESAETTGTEVPLTAAAPATGGEAAGKSLETKWPGVVAEVSEFRRKGTALTAKVRFTNNGAQRAQPDFYYGETYLLDADNKKYEVLKDEQGRYLAALRSGYPDRWYEWLEPGASQTVWMKFSAPSATVKMATLQVPGMEPFEELAIQD